MTTWRLPDDCLTTAWQLPDDCLMTAWWLSDDCLMTIWWLPNDCLPEICRMAAWCQHYFSPVTARRLPDEFLTTARRLPDDSLTTARRLPDNFLVTARRLHTNCKNHFLTWDCLLFLLQVCSMPDKTTIQMLSGEGFQNRITCKTDQDFVSS